MKREVYVMMDSISKNVGEPFTMVNDEEVRRAMKHYCTSSDFRAVPQYAMRDTVVFHVGTLVYENAIVRIVSDPCPAIIARGDAYFEKHDYEVSEETAPGSELPTA